MKQMVCVRLGAAGLMLAATLAVAGCHSGDSADAAPKASGGESQTMKPTGAGTVQPKSTSEMQSKD